MSAYLFSFFLSNFSYSLLCRDAGLPNSQVTTTTTTTIRTTAPGGPTTTAPGGPTTTSPAPPTSTDNPYNGYSVYLSPYYAAEIDAAAKLIKDSTLAAKALKIKDIPTFTWYDIAAKVPDLGKDLQNAKDIQTKTGQKQIVQIVVYDLPDR